MSFRIRQDKAARKAAWWAAGGIAIVLVVFIVGAIALIVILETGAYDPMFDGLNRFLDWEYAGPVVLLTLVALLITAARGWNWLRELDRRDEERERDEIPDSSPPDHV